MLPLKDKCDNFLWIAVCILLFSLFPVGAQEKDNEVEKRKPNFLEKEVHITQKKLASITANGERFRISKETTVINAMGVTLPIEDLEYPCTATIIFEPELYDNPMVIKIHVKDTDIGARTGWMLPAPE